MKPTHLPEDEQLMLRVVQNEIQELNILFQRYHRVLNAFFHNMGDDPQTAQDLTQDTFLRVLKFRHTFKQGYQFKSWMFRIAKNVRNDHLRKISRQPKSETLQHDAAFHEVKDPSTSAFQRQEQQEDLLQLKKAMQMLEPKYREVLFLARYEQLNYREIGKILGCSANHVKVQVFRALEKLKKHYHQLSETIPT